MELRTIKITLIGDSGTGKTCLINSFVNNIFLKNQIDFCNLRPFLKYINISYDDYDQIPCLLLIQDLPGLNSQQMNDPLIRKFTYENFDNKIDSKFSMNELENYNHQTLGYMLVFEIGDKNSLNNALDYHVEICKKEKVNNFFTKKIIIGTKSDLNARLSRDEKEKIKESQLKFYETSSLSYFNVEEVFHELSREIYYDKDIESFMKQNRLKQTMTQTSMNLDIENKEKKQGFFQFFKKTDQNEKNKKIVDLEEFSNCEEIQLENFSEVSKDKKSCLIFQKLFFENLKKFQISF